MMFKKYIAPYPACRRIFVSVLLFSRRIYYLLLLLPPGNMNNSMKNGVTRRAWLERIIRPKCANVFVELFLISSLQLFVRAEDRRQFENGWRKSGKALTSGTIVRRRWYCSFSFFRRKIMVRSTEFLSYCYSRKLVWLDYWIPGEFFSLTFLSAGTLHHTRPRGRAAGVKGKENEETEEWVLIPFLLETEVLTTLFVEPP